MTVSAQLPVKSVREFLFMDIIDIVILIKYYNTPPAWFTLRTSVMQHIRLNTEEKYLLHHYHILPPCHFTLSFTASKVPLHLQNGVVVRIFHWTKTHSIAYKIFLNFLRDTDKLIIGRRLYNTQHSYMYGDDYVTAIGAISHYNNECPEDNRSIICYI